MNELTIILTTTVNVNKSIYQINKIDRINTYLKSIKEWLENTKLQIVVVENSGYKFEELNNELEKYKERFEIITYNEANENEMKHIQNNTSIGISEIYSINYAFNKSKKIQNSKFIVKITGRYFIPDFETYISEFDLNNYDVLVQNDKTRCEIVGANIKNFGDVFKIKNNNQYLIYNGHIETVYTKRCSIYKNIIRCKKFNIVPTQRGGVNQIWDNL